MGAKLKSNSRSLHQTKEERESRSLIGKDEGGHAGKKKLLGDLKGFAGDAEKEEKTSSAEALRKKESSALQKK